MPIISIHSLPQHHDVDVPYLLQKLASLVAHEMNIPEYAVRCTWQELQPGCYVQGGIPIAKKQPFNSHGPIVHFTLFEGRGSSFIERIFSRIIDTLANLLNIDPKIICVVCHEHKTYQVLDKNPVIDQTTT